MSFPDHPFYFLPLSRPHPFLCVRLMNDITSSRLHEEATGGSSAGTGGQSASCHARFLSRTVCFPPFLVPSNFRDSHVSADSSSQEGGQRPYGMKKMEGISMVVNSLVTPVVPVEIFSPVEPIWTDCESVDESTPREWCVEGNETRREKEKKKRITSRPYLLQLIPAMTADTSTPPTPPPNEFRNVSYAAD